MESWQHALSSGPESVPRRNRRRLIVVAVAALMLALPIAVSASHIFSDVPTSNTFHSSISTLYGARITGGCGSGKYCPNDPVTRGSMAAFLVRGLGRMASVEDGAFDDWVPLTQPPQPPDVDHPFGIVAPISFRHGGGAGGTAHVFATGTVQVFTPETGVCPCEVQAYLFNSSTGEVSQVSFGMIGSEFAPIDPDLSSPVAYAETTMTMSYGFTVPSGVSNAYGIALKVIPTTAPTVDPDDALTTGWAATLQTIYVPFNELGGNPSTTNTQGKKVPRNLRPN